MAYSDANMSSHGLDTQIQLAANDTLSIPQQKEVINVLEKYFIGILGNKVPAKHKVVVE